MNLTKVIAAGVALLIISIGCFLCLEFKTVKGGELGIMETWNDGVVNEVYQPKNYFLFPSWSKEMYTYDATLLAFELSEYSIKSSDNQEMTIKSKIQWRRDPAKLVQHHKTFKSNAEKVAISPAMMSSILRHGTQYKAIEAFSGEGFIKMQADIQKDLINNQNLKDDGILIETFIIESIHLKPEYIEEINKRQLASLRQSRAIEEQKAAEAEALVAKSKAQADLNTKVVEAERDQQVAVLKAEAESKQTIIAAKAAAEQVGFAAEAEKKKTIAEAEGKKQASIAEAEGLLALGKSKAESRRLELEAFAAKGSDGFIKVEVAKSMAQAFQNVKGFLPSDLKMSILANDYNKAVDAITGNPIISISETNKAKIP